MLKENELICLRASFEIGPRDLNKGIEVMAQWVIQRVELKILRRQPVSGQLQLGKFMTWCKQRQCQTGKLLLLPGSKETTQKLQDPSLVTLLFPESAVELTLKGRDYKWYRIQFENWFVLVKENCKLHSPCQCFPGQSHNLSLAPQNSCGDMEGLKGRRAGIRWYLMFTTSHCGYR